VDRPTSEYFNRFSATSLGKVFFGPSALRSLCVFRGSSSLQKKQSSTAKGLLLGVFFSAEGPQGKNTFGKKIQRLVKATFSLGLAPQDEDSA
jgi:hypothetical protein